MDGRNSTGRTVSLLNDSAAESSLLAPPVGAAFRPTKTQLPSLSTFARPAPQQQTLHHHHRHPHSHSHSQSPSEASTPSLSPQTPPLIRSESSDSRAFGTPSPLTPQAHSFEHAHHPHPYRSWSKMEDHALYPPISEAPTLGFSLPPMGVPIPQMRSSDSPVSDSRMSHGSSSAAPTAKQGTKKSQYPCPLAKQFKCNDYFTTSGHAARHAKKHTGRKDAICPECNKAFTRKDNMEQHRRTHQNVRGPSKAAPDANRIKKPIKQSSRRDRSSISGPLEAAAAAQLDERVHAQMAQPDDFPVLPNSHLTQASVMPGSSGPYFMSAEPIPALPQPVGDYASRPPLYRSGFTGLSGMDFNTTVTPSLTDPELHFTYPSPGLSNGLNTLALVASDHRRMSEEASSAKSASTTP